MRLIAQIQERIQEIIAQQQEKKVMPAQSIASENNMSLATKVVLKSIDLVNSKITEKGSGSFKLKINETDSDEKYDLSLDFQEVKYDFFEKFFIDNFENNIKSDYYISIDSKNRIITEDMKMEIVYDDNDLRKYGWYIPESTKINFKTEISIKSMTE